jgi:hypothetical protein
MNDLLVKALQRKMNKLEQKLEKYATIFFGRDVTIMYIPKVKKEKE